MELRSRKIDAWRGCLQANVRLVRRGPQTEGNGIGTDHVRHAPAAQTSDSAGKSLRWHMYTPSRFNPRHDILEKIRAEQTPSHFPDTMAYVL